METKTLLYGVLLGVLVVGLIGINYTTSQNERIKELEIKNAEIESAFAHSQTLLSSIDKLNDLYVNSQANSSSLKIQLRMLEEDLTEQNATNSLLEEAIHMIGNSDILNLLSKYAETSVQLENLQDDYDKLLNEYIQLLSHQST